MKLFKIVMLTTILQAGLPAFVYAQEAVSLQDLSEADYEQLEKEIIDAGGYRPFCFQMPQMPKNFLLDTTNKLAMLSSTKCSIGDSEANIITIRSYVDILKGFRDIEFDSEGKPVGNSILGIVNPVSINGKTLHYIIISTAKNEVTPEILILETVVSNVIQLDSIPNG